MKGVGRVVALVLFSVLFACNKESRKTDPVVAAGTEISTTFSKEALYASGWQTVDHWQRDEKGYHARQKLPVKATGGKVLLYAKNVWAADEQMDEPMGDVALQLPFNFAPYTDQVGLSESWNYELEDEDVKIDFTVSGGNLEPRPVQFRCIYIPENVWATLKSENAEDLAYESIMQKLNLQP